MAQDQPSAIDFFLREAGEWEFGYQSEVRRRQRHDTKYLDPRAEVIEKARAMVTEAGPKSAVANAMKQLSQHALRLHYGGGYGWRLR